MIENICIALLLGFFIGACFPMTLFIGGYRAMCDLLAHRQEKDKPLDPSDDWKAGYTKEEWTELPGTAEEG